MKRIFSVLLIFILTLSLTVSVSALGNALSCKVTNDTLKAGQNVTVTVSIDGNEAFASIGLTFDFNRDVFEVESGKWVMSGLVLTDFNKSENRAVGALSNAVVKTGDIFELVLRVKDGAPAGTYYVKTEPRMKNGTLDVTVSKTEIALKVDAGTSNTPSDTQSSNQPGGNASEPLNHVHSYGDFVVDVKASCYEPGVKSRHCEACGHRKDITIIDATGHNWSDWTVEVEATVDTVGKKVRTCTNEGCSEKQYSEIAKLSADGHTHLFSDWFFTKQPTCTEKGEATRVCSICSEQEKTEAASLGHKYGQWVVKTQPTVDKEGLIECVCETCSNVKTFPLEKLKDTGSGVFSMPIIILICIVFIAGVIVVLVILNKKRNM